MEFNNATIYILTYNKEITEEYDSDLYVPLICGANSLNETHGYLCDDTGDNISDLNKYFTELTGQYWVWKNSDADIIGFCQYRRWFVKNFRFTKLTKKDVLSSLESNDIILPTKRKFTKSLYETIKDMAIVLPNYDAEYEDYVKIEYVLGKFFPDYEDTYWQVMNGNFLYSNNMFVCNRKLANQYFEWLFDVLWCLMDEIDFSKYESRDTRIFGFLSERLLTTWVVKNNLKIKEYDLYCTENFIPYLYLINCRFPRLKDIQYKIYYTCKKFL